MTDTGTKSFECTLVSTLETYDNPENGNYYINFMHYINYMCYTYLCVSGWLAGIYRFQGPLRARLQETNSLVESILGKLPLVPVGDTGTIPHSMSNLFPGAPGDCREGSGDGCRM
jgi:hypothetical protein